MSNLDQMRDDMYEGLGRHLHEMSSGWHHIAKQVDEFEAAIRSDERAAALREAADYIVTETTNATCPWSPHMPDLFRQLHIHTAELANRLRRMADEGGEAQ